MKIQVAISLAALACFAVLPSGSAQTEEQKQLMKQLRKTCLQETSADEGSVDACTQGNFAEDPKLKCYFKCVMQNVGVMDDGGVIDTDVLLAMMPESDQARGAVVLATCKNSESDPCEAAFQFNKCLQKEAPDRYIAI